MKLIQSNKYLRKPSTRNSLIISHAKASSRIEGIIIRKSSSFKSRTVKINSMDPKPLKKA